MFMSCLYFLLWAIYHGASWAMHDLAGRERNNFQQLPKLIEWKFIPSALPY